MTRKELRIGLGETATGQSGTVGAGRSVDERSLLRRVASREMAAFEQLYQIYYPRLFSYLFRILRRLEEVEETLNDVMMVVWERAGTFRGEARVSTWIFGIGYRQALRSLRRSRRQPALLSPEAVDEAGLTTEDRSRERRELQLTLSPALERLSPQHRAVVELTYYYGYSYREIAEIVGCPVNTVKSRMFHARRRLRELLSEPDDSAAWEKEEST